MVVPPRQYSYIPEYDPAWIMTINIMYVSVLSKKAYYMHEDIVLFLLANKACNRGVDLYLIDRVYTLEIYNREMFRSIVTILQ